MSNTIIKSARRFLVKNSPTIMATLGGAGAARAYLNGGYNETLDGLVLAVLELDKEGER